MFLPKLSTGWAAGMWAVQRYGAEWHRSGSVLLRVRRSDTRALLPEEQQHKRPWTHHRVGSVQLFPNLCGWFAGSINSTNHRPLAQSHNQRQWHRISRIYWVKLHDFTPRRTLSRRQRFLGEGGCQRWKSFLQRPQRYVQPDRTAVHELPGELPLRPLRPRLLRVQLCRQLSWIQVSPGGGVPIPPSVRASRSIDGCDLFPSVGHSKTQGQVGLTANLLSWNWLFWKGKYWHKVWSDPRLI